MVKVNLYFVLWWNMTSVLYMWDVIRHPCYMGCDNSLSRVVVPATLDSISVNAHFTRFL